VTNLPRGEDEGQGQKDTKAVAHLAPSSAVDAEQHSHDEVFWWRRRVLDIGCVRDRSDSQQHGRHRAHGLSHRARGVVPVDRALPLADSAACRQTEEESLALPGCLFALHVPTAGDRRMVQPGRGLGMVEIQVEGGANSVRRIEVGCHCWLSSWRRFHIHWERICQVS